MLWAIAAGRLDKFHATQARHFPVDFPLFDHASSERELRRRDKA